MDRFASNALRTLGLIALAICVIVVSLGLAFVGLCFAALSQVGNRPTPQTSVYFYLGIGAGLAVLIGGTFVIAKSARRIFQAESQDRPLPPPYPSTPPATPQTVPQSAASLPPLPPPRTGRDVATHLSPASNVAIQRLAAAIGAKIAAEVALGLVGWYGALGSSHAPFPLYQTGFMAWGIAAIAPHLVLLYHLARKPGRNAFAYALVIPSLHLLLGLFGRSAFLAFVLRPGQFVAPLLSIIPWGLDLVILYLAWKAIRQTGIEPDPPRLIVAAVVIFFYTSLLPVLVFLLNYFHR